MFKSSPEKIEEVVKKYPCEEISIEITEECKCRCIHCSSEAGNAWNNELSTGEIRELIKLGKEHLGTKVISLSGGDPVLRKDFVDIVKFIDSLGLNVLVYSSGIADDTNPFIHTEKYSSIIEIMRKTGNKIIYSLEGGNRFSHEFITRVAGSWDIVTDCIRVTVISGVYCEVHTCPMTTNMYELMDMYNVIASLGAARWSLLRIVPQGRCSEVRYLIPNKAEFRVILNAIGDVMEDANDREKSGEYAPEIRVGDPLNFYGCIYEKPIMPMTSCSAAKDRILIRANGETQFCAALKHSTNHNYGNCRDTNLVDLWVDSEMTNMLREFHEGGYKKIQGSCSTCKNLGQCRGGCVSQRIATHGDINIGPDPLCTFHKK